jgi:hypothetical protein
MEDMTDTTNEVPALDRSIARMIAEVKAKTIPPSISYQQTVARELLKFAVEHQKLNYLKSRWLDEREYEDFAEYETAIRQLFTDVGYTVKKVSRSFTVEVNKNNVNMQLKVGPSRISVSLIAEARSA